MAEVSRHTRGARRCPQMRAHQCAARYLIRGSLTMVVGKFARMTVATAMTSTGIAVFTVTSLSIPTGRRYSARTSGGHCYHVNGVARSREVVIAASGKLRIALGIGLDWMLRQHREFLALIRVVRPEVRFHDYRRGIGGQRPRQFHRGRGAYGTRSDLAAAHRAHRTAFP